MFVKLCLRNIRNGLRDHAVYFLTLIIAVSVFYVFNAVGDQAAMMQVNLEGGGFVRRLSEVLSAISLLVSIMVGLLIVYASRFLMRRRSREFALYLLLGMRRWQVSAILVLETALIGVGSLAVGLVLGITLSQLMSTLVAGLFETDLTAYRFGVSQAALSATVRNFVVMYVVVMLLGSRAVTHMRLVELMQSGRRPERVRLKNPVLCVIVFCIAALMLGCAYYMVGWNYLSMTGAAISAYILIGSVATLLVFWSVSGLLLRVAQRMRTTYFRGLNCFTFRQISSKANTVVFSMTVICLLLFFTICMLSSAFCMRNGMNSNLTERCPADFEVRHAELTQAGVAPTFDDVAARYAAYGMDLTADLGDYVHFHSYADPALRLTGDDGASAAPDMVPYAETAEVVRLGDYNRLMELYGRDVLDLGEDEFAFVCDFEASREAADRLLRAGAQLQVFGHTLRSHADESQDGFINLAAARMNTGLYVVPDAVADEAGAAVDYVVGNYDVDGEEERRALDERMRERHEAFEARFEGDEDAGLIPSYSSRLFTRIEIRDDSLSGSVLLTFVCLYLGLVFLVACGAILALRGLTESVDGVQRYETLRAIGTSEEDICRSLFLQTAAFFIMPLILACIHAIFGMRFMMGLMALAGTQGMLGSHLITVSIILLIYGGYFIATYLGSKRIIQGR